ncbi:MAG: transcription elongation factor GreB [Betaproteobacteria bacterium]|nr:transcription elongation factor GreB [Betaproteobacteria bacterium]
MSKAFTKESDQDPDDDLESGAPPVPAGSKNYITPRGQRRLLDELRWLLDSERPEVTATVSWAAKNGDRSENGDYLYGKKRLREIDRRIRFLNKRLDAAEVVDPRIPRDDPTRIFFGATVTFAHADSREQTVSIVGVDEIDTARGHISWISPLARCLIKAREGDTVQLVAPGGVESLDILEVRYADIDMPAFQPVAPVGINPTLTNIRKTEDA